MKMIGQDEVIGQDENEKNYLTSDGKMRRQFKNPEYYTNQKQAYQRLPKDKCFANYTHDNKSSSITIENVLGYELLTEYMRRSFPFSLHTTLEDNIKSCIQRMHEHKISHMNLHSNNIIVNDHDIKSLISTILRSVGKQKKIQTLYGFNPDPFGSNLNLFPYIPL